MKSVPLKLVHSVYVSEVQVDTSTSCKKYLCIMKPSKERLSALAIAIVVALFLQA